MKKQLKNPQFPCADPFVLNHEGKYYLYGTTDAQNLAPYFNTEGEQEEGIRVFVSDDLCNWTYLGFALKRGDVIGDKWFWAPEIAYRNGKFYMVYTANEHVGIAVADKPEGPFTQEEKRWISDDFIIDGHFFFDTDGSAYLYYVRLIYETGNTIFGARLKENLTEVDFSTEKQLIKAEADWETIDCLVTEGPFVLKHNDIYFLTYSANHTRSPYYSVGYASSSKPLGPFKKYDTNPILKMTREIVGVGHHSFTTSKKDGSLICVYHCHNSPVEFTPRLLCFDKAEFKSDGYKTVLNILGPTTKKQRF